MNASPLLEVSGLNAFYGGAQALHDVTFSIGHESVAIVGRNGMGKTTLCAAIMGLSFGALYKLTGSLLGPVVAHVAINWVNLRFLRDSDFEPPRQRALGGLLGRA